MVKDWQHFRGADGNTWIKPPADIRIFTISQAFQFGIHQKVKIWFCNNITTPLTFGFFKPVILMPFALVNNLSLAETESLIIHELAHIKNHDFLLNIPLVVCETLFFFNPFIKSLGDQVRLEREMECDLRVLQFRYGAIGYAETLLKTAKLKASSSPFVLSAFLRKTHLLKRIQFFTAVSDFSIPKRSYVLLIIAPLLIGLSLNFLILNHIHPKGSVKVIAKNHESHKKSGLEIYHHRNILFTETPDLPAKASPETQSFLYKGAKNAKPKSPELLHKFSPDPSSNNMENIFPAALLKSNDTKVVTIKDEDPQTGKSVTRTFNMKLINGEWHATLMWTITESNHRIDTLQAFKDSLIVFPAAD